MVLWCSASGARRTRDRGLQGQDLEREENGGCHECGGLGVVWCWRTRLKSVGVMVGVIAIGLGAGAVAVWAWGSGGRGGMLSILAGGAGLLAVAAGLMGLPAAWADGWKPCRCASEAQIDAVG